jgi:hypothetical protein
VPDEDRMEKPAGAKNPWRLQDLKDRPIAIIVIVTLAVGGITWGVSEALRVEPLKEENARLRRDMSSTPTQSVPEQSRPIPADRQLPFDVHPTADRRDQGVWLNAIVNHLTQEGEAERDKFADYIVAWIEFAPLPEPLKFRVRLSTATDVFLSGMFAFRVHRESTTPQFQELQVRYEERHRTVDVPETQSGDTVLLLVRLSSKKRNRLPGASALQEQNDLRVRVLPP